VEEEVVKEWAEAWKKTKTNYDKGIYETLSLQKVESTQGF